MSKGNLTIWFDHDGNLIDLASSWKVKNYPNLKSEDGRDFQDDLEYQNIKAYGNNAARVYFKSICSGRTYSMFTDDFHNVIMAKKFIGNRVSGTFRFVKKGQAQGIKLVL